MSMNSNPVMQPSLTPNVVVANPAVRRVMTVVLGVAALVLPILSLIDAGAPGISFDAWLPTAGAIEQFLIGAFAVGVIAPNVPSVTNNFRIAQQEREIGGDL